MAGRRSAGWLMGVAGLRPHHLSTRAAVAPVQPGVPTRYDIEIFPTAALIAPGHRLRLTLTS